jgi:hypothetical protein
MRHLRRLACVIIVGTVAGPAFGQGADAALKDRVGQLVERLADSKVEAAEAAERSLVELGERALPLLPEESKLKSAGARKRLKSVRESIAEKMEQTNLGASLVTIQGKGIRLTEALKQLQSQSGNRITDLREGTGAEVTNPSLDLEIEKMPFFQALDLIAKRADVTPNYYTGDGSIGLMAGPGIDADLPDQIGVKSPPTIKNPVHYSGPFRVQIKTLALSRDFATGAANGNTQFEVAWEPRLRPMLMGLKAENIAIIDDHDDEVPPSVTDESGNVVLRPENPIAELNLNMTAPDRMNGVKTLKSIKVKAEITLPAGLKTFKFANLKKPAEIQKGDISVALLATEAEEDVWKVRVDLVYPGEGPAFESYRQGLFNNRIWLQKADGSRFELNGGFSNYGSGGGKLGFEYLFVDVPGKMADYGFVYETPSKVLTIPLEFEFRDVPLP